MTDKSEFIAKLSLSFLWVFTGITSLFFASDIGYQVLANGGITGPLATFSLVGGSLLDLSLGLWLLIGKKLKWCYLAQIAVIVLFTFLLSIIDPSFWLHPFGPLTKNIPILVLITFLYRDESLEK